MLDTIADDFALQILIGERIAHMIWNTNALYWGVIAAYAIWRYLRYKKGDPLCHHRNCKHIETPIGKKEASSVHH